MRIFYLEKTGGYNFLLHQNYAFEIFSDITSCLFSRQIIIHQPCLCAILADPLLGIPKQLCHKNLSNGQFHKTKLLELFSNIFEFKSSTSPNMLDKLCLFIGCPTRGYFCTNPNNALLWGKSCKRTIRFSIKNLIPPKNVSHLSSVQNPGWSFDITNI